MTKHIKQKSIKPIAAVVGGVIAGAGLAIAGAIALKNKKVSNKVSKVLKDIKTETMNMSQKAKSNIDKSIKKIEKNN
ncbi:MAG: hypothetical protein COU63_01960 [Candidatus Pacebacteria bacterium CG10_big_fil_rev_8_21_14_0_10_36_11]|nr:hypothetical protein [Candidatus Pacearchaeota archaeon]OIP73656.1 MAG: hypothetical protein AUK08_03765 [Candidatus Pacebacteria bacterium CG2_30_36_39]PIR64762.1 MAG: hypothetical protein COU63_01960 [Candidatus Pacebacteria bacterium CG10_big_fil_rev_8_21_14_0_10_36_11]PJC42326.1 MAG: hypothetical protein CO040_05085 [Candidatus Pacebacteria bacterium CG_4_9_14_0_2_um_filter_36_8]